MTPNPHLERIIARENYAAMLRGLRPRELAVVALRLDDLPFDFTGEVLGLTRNTAYQRLKAARHLLTVLFPHIRSMVGDS
jgi:DNA-directed RNA polymerase specialized sigma24 family protein